ncbi:hypothetical protein Vadar_002286 [Vaccinium darrowii]|uniref:Uncharacterized protein n=1 Tax=Vaccinium darrowii TaxID=229202 RepID=A0ACB7YUC1_9ERIC|nr:hypothetical protein Vadar_002286 [Vaccinium darrowii]
MFLLPYHSYWMQIHRIVEVRPFKNRQKPYRNRPNTYRNCKDRWLGRRTHPYQAASAVEHLIEARKGYRFMRHPPLLRRSEYLNMLNDIRDFETKRHREGFPVENFVQQKIEACRALQKLGENYTEQYLMTKIVELLSPSWNHVKYTIFENRVINNAIDLMNTLMYEERNVHPLWIEFEQGQMIPNSTVREHILDKEKQFHNLKKKGFKPHIVILVKAIVKNLPPTWPKSKVFVSLKEKFPDLRELGAMLEEIENDMICLQALDEAEKQLNHQEEKHDKEDKEKQEQEDIQEKHQQKGVKQKLEFDDP